MIESFTLIVPAAGESRRYGRNKLLEPLAGKPILFHTLTAFLARRDVAQIVLATGHDFSIDQDIAPLLSDERVIVRPGGVCRAESVRNAVLAAPEKLEWIAIHDAARPLVSRELIDRTLAGAFQYGCAAPALPVALTIKQATGPLPARVERTVPRERLWAMQTPQIMRRGDLLEAYETCSLPMEQVTDDVQLLELAGKPVYLVEGEQRNLKITTPGDLVLAERFLGDPAAAPRRGA
jgi:2-C-methyl-D-erythritol 4-phosphate cytidylyltransferase